jgi:hypothetical protein
VEHRDEVIVERHGAPTAVIMAYDEYEAVPGLREQARRRALLEQLQAVKDRVSARNADLSEEQAMELADRLVRDTIDDMVAEGKIRFERDRR